MCVGDCFDTPRFAVEALADWWTSQGRQRFPSATRLLVLADGGGSNASRSRVWKSALQDKLADDWGLEVTVCHYPPGCSKWNPVEHRLFSFLSLNWAGVPLRSFEIVMNHIRSTVTRAGLVVTGTLMRGGNEKGERVSDQDFAKLCLERHGVCPDWNYTIRPHGKSG